MENGEVPKMTIDELKRKLNRLSTLDRELQDFGATGHQYKSHPVSEAELDQFEAELGVCLPEDYRQFLQEVGYGAGPYYGLLSPNQVLEAMREESSEWPDSKNAPGCPFPFSHEQAQECFRIMSELRCGWLEGQTWLVDGCIPICFEGCSFYTLIVTAGDLAGSIWSSSRDSLGDGDDDVSFPYNLAPRPPGNIYLAGYKVLAWEPALSPEPTFLEWYNAWLDQCLSDPQQQKVDQPVKPPEFGRYLWWSVAVVLIMLIISVLSK